MDILNLFLSAFFTVIIENFVFLTITFATLLIGIFGVLYARKSVRISQISAERPIISLEFYGSSEQFFLIPMHFRSGCLFAVPFIITIKSKNKKHIEEAEIWIDYPEFIYRSKKESGISRNLPNWAVARNISYAVDPIDGQERARIYYKLGNIPIGIPFRIEDIIFFSRDTVVFDSAECKTLDDVPISIGFGVLFTWYIEVMVAAKDCEPLSRRIEIALRTLNQDDMGIDNINDFCKKTFEQELEICKKLNDNNSGLPEKFAITKFYDFERKLQTTFKSPKNSKHGSKNFEILQPKKFQLAIVMNKITSFKK